MSAEYEAMFLRWASMASCEDLAVVHHFLLICSDMDSVNEFPFIDDILQADDVVVSEMVRRFTVCALNAQPTASQDCDK